MSESGGYHGGLVFFGYEDGLLDQFTRITADTLEDYGHPVERQSVMNKSEARITASHYYIKLSVEQPNVRSDQTMRSQRLDDIGRLNPGRPPLADPPWRLQIELCPADPSRDDQDISELLMVVMLYRLIDTCEASAIEWMDPATVLTLNTFLKAFANTAPQLVAGQPGISDGNIPDFVCVDEIEKPLPRQCDTIWNKSQEPKPVGPIRLSEQEKLALAFRTEPHPHELDASKAELNAQSDIRRLAVWGMTGMMATMSTPVAVSVAAVNLIRGEDLRMNTHVLSLTGLLVMLQSSGALASVVEHLPL